jgi:hypothetical protein
MRHWRELIAVVLVAATLGACSSSRTADTRRGAVDAAQTPLRDLGLVREEVPILLRNLQYPYSTATLASGCPAIAHEIRQLDEVLGPESFQPGPSRNIWDRSGDFAEEQTIDAFQNTAEDLIPFRSWVRRLSGASRAERDALRAFANGQQRRTFLRGYGASLGCPNAVPPPPPQVHTSRSRDDRPVN